MAKRRPADVVRIPIAENTEQPKAGQSTMDAELVQRRAYEIFESRGRHHGAALDDWLQAEQELRSGERDVRYVR